MPQEEPVSTSKPRPASQGAAPAGHEDEKFWTTERKANTAALAVEVAVDGYKTQYWKNHDPLMKEDNPIARPLVMAGIAGQVGASALGMGAVLGAQWLAHKLGHDEMAKWIGRAAVAGEGLNAAREVGVGALNTGEKAAPAAKAAKAPAGIEGLGK